MAEPPFRENLRALIDRKLADGTLPRGALGAISETYGAGEVCDACAKHVSHSDVLYRVYRDFRRIHFHRACFSIWMERASTRASPKPTYGNANAP